ncbi:50S ribosomal protein L18e [Candidatus Woesearchaeota archaeon]|nr:50S ribosomal protein L18e [Candidatus Woesearchaeota archaeon]
MKRTFTNTELVELIGELKKTASQEEVKIWKAVAIQLEAPARKRRVVNLHSINAHTKDNDVVVVPGKVLASGDLDHTVSIAAFSFSGQAKEKIHQAKGEAMSISELVQKNPKGAKVKILG